MTHSPPPPCPLPSSPPLPSPPSLRNNMFELADHLVGIYKTNNCTKSITIDPRSFVVATAQQQVDC